MSNGNKTVRIKVSPEVAKIVAKGASRELKLQASRGALPLSARDLLTALLFLAHSGDVELSRQALETLGRLPTQTLASLLADPELHPQLLDLVARQRLGDAELMESLLANPATGEATLLHLARHSKGRVLSLLCRQDRRLEEFPEVLAVLLSNPALADEEKNRLGKTEPIPAEADREGGKEEAAAEGDSEETAGDDSEQEAEEDLNLSKYQMALEMGVSEKIKMALIGDKEWRSIFLKDANKLVSSAVLKNPRITDGEVLAVAKNKSSSDELIRLITLNNEWVKNYEVKKALIVHPKTPLPKALRYMNVLGEKDLKSMSKSRNISQVLVNNARRMLMAKEKKKG